MSEAAAPRPLTARDITKTFVDGEQETEVLRGVDLELERAEFVSLQGPSGSGKSTLLSILGTLLRPTGGTLELDGESALGVRGRALDRLRNAKLGFVYQFHYLLPDFSATENVLMPWNARYGLANEEATARARELLVRVGLEGRLDYRVTKLSGGQKQRVAIARALMMTPSVVLADEPTGNLDRETAFEVMELLREIAGESDTAFLISTHDPEIADRCDRRVHIVDGRVDQDAGR